MIMYGNCNCIILYGDTFRINLTKRERNKMYNRDCKAIEQHSSNSPQGLVDVIEFTLCTIQAGLSTVKAQRLDIQKKGGDSKY